MRGYYSYFLPLFLCLILVSACASGDRAEAPQPISPEPLYTVVMKNGLVSEIVEKYNVGADELSETVYGYDQGQLAHYDYKGRRAVSTDEGKREMLDIVLSLSFEDGEYVSGDKTVNRQMASPVEKDIREARQKSEEAKKRVLGTRYQKAGQKEILVNSSNIMPAKPVEDVSVADEMTDQPEINAPIADTADAEQLVISTVASTEDMSKKLISSPTSLAVLDEQMTVDEIQLSEKPLPVEDLIRVEREPVTIQKVVTPKEVEPKIVVQEVADVLQTIDEDTDEVIDKSIEIYRNTEWPTNLMDLMPAIEACLEVYEIPGLVRVPFAWTTSTDDISVFIQNKDDIHFCGVSGATQKVTGIVEWTGKDQEGDLRKAFFSPHTSAYPDGECFTHDLIFDDDNKFKGWLSTNGC